jgi:CheY-like chemotaxis protein
MDTKSCYILLADDDMEDQSLLKDLLLELDPTKKIDSVSDGGAVLDYLHRCPDADLPCLIILDFKLPVMNADEVLDALASDLRYKEIPKIVWSTSNQQSHVNTCLQRGAKAYFTKPGDFHQLGSIASQMLKLSACN